MASSSISSTASPKSPQISDDSSLLHRLFQLLDLDHNGSVCSYEILSLLQKLGLSTSTVHAFSSSLRSSFPHLDPLQHLDFSQFQALYASLFSQEASSPQNTPFLDAQASSPVTTGTLTEPEKEEETEPETDADEIAEAFSVYDKNGDGLISASELATVLQQLGLLPPWSGDEEDDRVKACQDMIDRVDANGDGFVDIHEFRSMLQARPPPKISETNNAAIATSTVWGTDTKLLRSLTKAFLSLVASISSMNLLQLQAKHGSGSVDNLVIYCSGFLQSNVKSISWAA